MKRKRLTVLLLSVTIAGTCGSISTSAREYKTKDGVRAGVVTWCAGMIPKGEKLAEAPVTVPAVEVTAPEVLTEDPDDTKIGRDEVLICEDAGQLFHVSPELLEAIIENESNGEQYAKNGPCIGLMQIDYRYHTGRMQRVGFSNLWDKRANIYTGADLLAELCGKYGDIGTALMAYNGTKGAAARTKLTPYAEKILNRSAELERIHGK